MADAGFEPAPFQTSALNWRLRPLGQSTIEPPTHHEYIIKFASIVTQKQGRKTRYKIHQHTRTRAYKSQARRESLHTHRGGGNTPHPQFHTRIKQHNHIDSFAHSHSLRSTICDLQPIACSFHFTSIPSLSAPFHVCFECRTNTTRSTPYWWLTSSQAVM